MLTDTTLRAIEQLQMAPILENVGRSQGEALSIPVRTWDEAIVYLTSDFWPEVQLRAGEDYRHQLSLVAPQRWRNWNEMIDILHPPVRSIIESKVYPNVPETLDYRKMILSSIQWDLLHLFVECQNVDVLPLGFYVSQGYYYLKGYLPCGWIGDLPPDGQPVVF